MFAIRRVVAASSSKRPAFFSAGLLTNTAPKSFFSTYKTSTGLVGLAVDLNGRENLISLSSQILSSVQKIPADSQYRVNVEKWFSFITKTCSSTEDIRAIEDEIGLGQIEEVIEMAKDELSLVDYYFENRGWELVADEKSRADAVVAEMADSIHFTTQSSTVPPPPPPPPGPPPK